MVSGSSQVFGKMGLGMKKGWAWWAQGSWQVLCKLLGSLESRVTPTDSFTWPTGQAGYLRRAKENAQRGGGAD